MGKLLCLLGFHKWYCWEYIIGMHSSEIQVPKCGRCGKIKIAE